jgi:hypothetical protein
MKLCFRAGAALLALAIASPAVSREAAPARTAVVQEAELLTLSAGVPITLAVAKEINSSMDKAGDTFPLTVLNDVKIGDTIVIPRGTPAVGEITWRTGKGAFGKSGKMEFSLRYIELGGQRIPLIGDFQQEGEGNTIATGIGIIAVGVFAGFITGKRARVPMGRELMATVAQPVLFTTGGALVPSYDGQAAYEAMLAKTPLGQCRAKAGVLKGKKKDKAVEKCYSKRMA